MREYQYFDIYALMNWFEPNMETPLAGAIYGNHISGANLRGKISVFDTMSNKNDKITRMVIEGFTNSTYRDHWGRRAQLMVQEYTKENIIGKRLSINMYVVYSLSARRRTCLQSQSDFSL